MATHGYSGVLGSVAERVIHDSPVPVLLMRPGAERVTQLKTLVLPTDGSVGAAVALGSRVGLARASGARLVLVEAVEPYRLWLYGTEFGVAPTYVDPAWDEDALRAAQAYVAAVVARLKTAGLEARGEARIGAAVASDVESVWTGRHMSRT